MGVNRIVRPVGVFFRPNIIHRRDEDDEVTLPAFHGVSKDTFFGKQRCIEHLLGYLSSQLRCEVLRGEQFAHVVSPSLDCCAKMAGTYRVG